MGTSASQARSSFSTPAISVDIFIALVVAQLFGQNGMHVLFTPVKLQPCTDLRKVHLFYVHTYRKSRLGALAGLALRARSRTK
jgi:hypothetical protein